MENNQNGNDQNGQKVDQTLTTLSGVSRVKGYTDDVGEANAVEQAEKQSHEVELH